MDLLLLRMSNISRISKEDIKMEVHSLLFAFQAPISKQELFSNLVFCSIF